MHSLLLFSILASLALSSQASPLTPFSLQPRRPQSSAKPGEPGILATITSSNGTDLTSNFQTLIYHAPDVGANHAVTDLENRDLLDNRSPGTSRLINSCKNAFAQFRASECDYRASFRHSMQRYRVTCFLPNRYSQGGSDGTYTYEIVSLPSLLTFNHLSDRLDEVAQFASLRIFHFLTNLWDAKLKGLCNGDEICINGPQDKEGNPTVATCIGQRNFESIPGFDTPEGRARMEQFLEDSRASAIVSQEDRQTVMSVESLEIDAGVAGVGRAGGQVGPTSQKRCTNCAEIETGKFEEGTDFLSTEVTIATAGAAAGILWLAVLSG